jgi:hypothetical protein
VLPKFQQAEGSFVDRERRTGVRWALFTLVVLFTPADAVAAACGTTGTQMASEGDLVLYRDDASIRTVLRVYRVVRGCPTLLGSLVVDGQLAFAHVHADTSLSVDTWLMHGDRLRRHYKLGASGYDLVSQEEIPGPRFSP